MELFGLGIPNTFGNGCGFKFYLQPPISTRLTPNKRIHNFQMPRNHTLEAQGTFQVVWKLSKIYQLYICRGKIVKLYIYMLVLFGNLSAPLEIFMIYFPTAGESLLLPPKLWANTGRGPSKRVPNRIYCHMKLPMYHLAWDTNWTFWRRSSNRKLCRVFVYFVCIFR